METTRIKIAVLFALLTGLSCLCQAQKKFGKNLVPNPGFELHKTKSADIKNAMPWVGIETVDQYAGISFVTNVKGKGGDYYLKPDKRDTSRFRGARNGVGYAGLRFQKNHKEYLYVKLNEPLERGATYHYRMYVRILESESVTVAVKQLGVYFSDEPFKVAMGFNPDAIIDTTYKKGITGTSGWIPILGDYVAHGREKYIIIGNFRTKIKDDFVKKNKMSIFESAEAYYYLDDISVRKRMLPADSLKMKAVVAEALFEMPDSLSTGQVIEIKNLQFENGDVLSAGSQKILNEVTSQLNNHPFVEFEVSSYDKDAGLAKRRAKAIVKYLKTTGSILTPLTSKGFPLPKGETEPRTEIKVITQ
ncbi:MAG: hypothetical protein M3R27_14775 [Bacteroidota bacterium]|nr:hypothetical protein [Bacteroidota bacterium]